MAVKEIAIIDTKNSAVVGRIWEGLTHGDVGARFPFSQYTDKTVHIYGDFGTGASVTLRGSNKPDADPSVPTDWLALTDAQANAITKTAAAIEVVLESPLWVSPAVAAGDASANITIALVGKEA